MSNPLTKALRNLAVQDYFIYAYLVVLLLALRFGGAPATGPKFDMGNGFSLPPIDRSAAYSVVLMDLGILTTGILLSRGELLPWLRLRGLAYRLGVFFPVLLSYFQLRLILPAVTSRALDEAIYRFDLNLFGFEPAVAWDRFVNPATTAWFGFFYFFYFFVLASHVIGFMLFSRRTSLLLEFSLGINITFCVAHIIYMMVPGFGPFFHLRGTFVNDLEQQGSFFYQFVANAVRETGAMKDIFPSLHTGIPSYIAIFSFRHRDKLPFKYSWIVVALITSQIIIATMFLRWHYLIDIFAGLTLATFANLAIGKIIPWEIQRRKREGLPPVFEQIRGDASPAD